MSKIGIYSGTFDPIHEGHIMFAQTALEQYGLDQVVFMVERKPRHKSPQANAKQRIAMVEIMMQKAPRFKQIQPPQDTQSGFETLDFLMHEYADDDLVLIMGTDSFESLPQWDGRERIIESCAFIVGMFGEDDGEIAVPLATELSAEAKFLPAPLRTVRSSSIRYALKGKTQPKGLDEDVEAFIVDNKLYV